MTLKELSQLHFLRLEQENDRHRLERLRKEYGNTYDEVREIEAVISEKQKRCLTEQLRLEEYISGIADSVTRQIFALRFIEDMSWVQVAHRLGGGNTSDGVKKICYRYLSETNKKRREC